MIAERVEDNLLITADCLEAMRVLEENSVDSVVTDPPYGLNFLNHKWDCEVPSSEIWEECLRVTKPGGFLLAFSSSRTYHRMAMAIENAGWVISDQLMWLYSSMPKSLDIAKSFDKRKGHLGKQGKSFNVVGNGGEQDDNFRATTGYRYKPVSKEAKQWDGWGSRLKPCHEPIVMAQKPLSEPNIATNIERWGTGGINILGCRIKGEDIRVNYLKDFSNFGQKKRPKYHQRVDNRGRFPANVVLDGSEEVIDCFPEERIAKFYYHAKADRKDKGEHNTHPTVKPTELMQWLCRLVTPPRGTVLDPFMGSGSSGKACCREGFGFIGIEKDAAYSAIAKERILFECNLLKGEQDDNNSSNTE